MLLCIGDICAFGDKRHIEKKKTFTGCPFAINIKIKLITKATFKMDKKVRDFSCYITIQGRHNHSTESAAALKQLRVLPDTKEEFMQYFALGMTPCQAARFHEEKFGLDLSLIANSAAINPSKRAVAYIHECWLQEHHGSIVGNSMFNAIKSYAEKNKTSTIRVEGDEDRFTIVLVTEFMLRVHKELREAGELVDQLNTSGTVLLCSGPAGAAPLGVLFMSSQIEEAYEAGFDMLKNVLGEHGFFGKGFPDSFITDNIDPERKALRKVWPNAQLFLCIFHILQQLWRWVCNTSHGIQKDNRQLLMQVVRKLVYADQVDKFDEVWASFLQSPEAHKYNQYRRYLWRLVQRREEWSLSFRAGKLFHGHNTNNYAESTICIIKDVIHNRF
ncbi:uncharacterized protein [Macrobrachium rosenbergii]|uniref:uncharacterized protein isoform X2 n=1 Tax=Macrobrachium rosenbergii TaxID=79674 RepID=UPI0034D691D5